MTSPWAVPVFTNITLPTSAGPGESRIVIGPDLPPPLDTYVWADDGIPSQGSRYVGAIIFYGNSGDDSYSFIGFTKNSNPIFPFYQLHIGAVNQGAMVEVSAGIPAGTVWYFVIDDPSPDLRNTESIGQKNMNYDVLFMTNYDGATGTVFFGGTDWTTIDSTNQPVYFPFAPERVTCNANTNVGAANTSIPGTSVTVDAVGTFDYWEVVGNFSVAAIVAPTSQMSGGLLKDGVLQSGSAGPVRMFTNGEKTMVSQTWIFTGLSAGSHTFQLSAVAGVANEYSIASGDTSIVVKGMYGGQS